MKTLKLAIALSILALALGTLTAVAACGEARQALDVPTAPAPAPEPEPEPEPVQSIAAFTWSQAVGSLTVQFVDQSLNATEVRWDFGDGAGITFESNPIHTYAVEGDYVVSLTACPETDFSSVLCDTTSRLVTVLAVEPVS